MTPPRIAADRTGRGIVVAVVDTGVNFAHPHLRCPGRGWSVRWVDGALEVEPDGFGDRFGHGTCCAALVHALAPDAALWAVRVCESRPTTDADRIARAIEHVARAGADVVCVALGTRTALRGSLDRAVRDASALVVAARPDDETLPAGCPGALGVGARDGVDVVVEASGLWAEGKARPAFGHARNFAGPSLATARAAAALARWAEASGERGTALLEGFSKNLVVR